MARYVVEVTIARPRRVVFDFLTTHENLPRYVEGCISATQLSGVRGGVGSRVIRLQLANGRTTDSTENVLVWEDGSATQTEGRTSFARYEANVRFEDAAGGGTRVMMEGKYSPAHVGGWIMWPLFLIAMRGRLERSYEMAKRVLESEDAGAYRAAG